MPFGKNSLRSLYQKVGDIPNPIPTNSPAQKFSDSTLPLPRKLRTTLSNMLSLLGTAKTKEDSSKEGWKPKEGILGIVSIVLPLSWGENVVLCSSTGRDREFCAWRSSGVSISIVLSWLLSRQKKKWSINTLWMLPQMEISTSTWTTFKGLSSYRMELSTPLKERFSGKSIANSTSFKDWNNEKLLLEGAISTNYSWFAQRQWGKIIKGMGIWLASILLISYCIEERITPSTWVLDFLLARIKTLELFSLACARL